MENLVGRKIRGFKFEKTNEIEFNPKMNKFIGEIGGVYYQDDDRIGVKFETDKFNDNWSYPIEEAMGHLLKETPQEKVDRLTKELEQAKKELNTKVCIVVYKKRNGAIGLYNQKEQLKDIVVGEPDKDGDLILDIIEREYSI